MRLVRRILLSSLASMAGLAGSALLPGVSGTAFAQNDISPRLPDVLLLLDTSGSMDYLIAPGADGVTPVLPGDPSAPGSACTLNGQTTVLNRWASLVSVLTGSFAPGAFGCETLMRTEPKFVTEFSLPTLTPNAAPYDYNYYIPWHRIYSNQCTLGASKVTNPANWSNWGSTPFDQHNSTGQCLNGTNPANCCTWSGQNNDGLLDVFSGMVRFGMMTFDTLPDPSTGSTTPTTEDGPAGIRGTWSYFHNWQNWTDPNPPPVLALGSPYVGYQTQPAVGPAAGVAAGCTVPKFMEVGARNAAAPPWEGPMTAFGNPASDTNIGQVNAAIQNQILAMRPYGATPIAGMFSDAREFLFYDTTSAPNVTPAQQFGPSNDPYWQGGCRKMYQILLTDGYPNMDMRGASGECDASGNPAATCPYDTPEDILTLLRTNPPGGNLNMSVTTYIVGFAIPNPVGLPGNYTSCQQLQPTDCLNPPATLQACCKLQSLALAGGGTGATAFFANNPTQLKAVLSSILSQIVGTTTARTSPIYSLAPAANVQGTQLQASPALSYNFAASFNVTSSATEANFATGGGTTGPWSGNLVRERYSCVSGVPTPQPVTPSDGDDYAQNLNQPDSGHPRQFFTVIGPSVASGSSGGSTINSDWTMRPFVAADDGFGVSIPQTTGGAMTPVTNFPALMSNYPQAFAIQPTGTDQNCLNAFGLTNQPQQCVTDLVNWEVGVTNTLPAALSPAPSRNPASPYCQANAARSCSLLGAIYHSTPVVVGPPREFLRDDTYSAYANDPTVSTQPMVLYTATIDGQLHAFKVSSTTTTDTFTTDHEANNELWSFFPPAVLQHIMPNYNSGGANLLDGSPVIADVPGHAQTAAGPVFQRAAGDTAPTVWHRVLVAGGGAAGGFYYALEVTNPLQPQFLWQISTDATGHRLFGASTPQPAIAIIGMGTGTGRVDVPVAILSGGSDEPLTTCTTPPANPPHTTIGLNDPQNPSNPSGSLFPLTGFHAPPLHCWPSYSAGSPNAVPNNGTQSTGNSITIVRLDTGQVLAHITGTGYYGAIGGGVVGDPGTGQSYGNPPYSFTTRPFTSPMTGIPVPYPNGTGQVADRLYVGDADGQLWRVDLSAGSPTGWANSSAPPLGITLSWDAYLDSPASSRESIQIAPVISRDPVGNVVIDLATGDQNLLTSQSNDNRVWSITETPAAFNTSQNWYLKFAPTADRVTGPMALFNEVLYFSTYTPVSTSGNACQNGFPSLYGADYRRPNSANQPYIGAPLPELTLTNGVAPSLLQTGTSGSVIFGVAATETPSCSGTTNTTDAYFGSHSAVSGVSQSEYRIMWQTGAGSGISTGGNVRNETGVTGMQNMTVPSPGLSSRVDSWAAVVE